MHGIIQNYIVPRAVFAVYRVALRVGQAVDGDNRNAVLFGEQINGGELRERVFVFARRDALNAYRNGNTRKEYRAVAGRGILTHTVTNERLARRGYYGISEAYKSMHSI